MLLARLKSLKTATEFSTELMHVNKEKKMVGNYIIKNNEGNSISIYCIHNFY